MGPGMGLGGTGAAAAAAAAGARVPSPVAAAVTAATAAADAGGDVELGLVLSQTEAKRLLTDCLSWLLAAEQQQQVEEKRGMLLSGDPLRNLGATDSDDLPMLADNNVTSLLNAAAGLAQLSIGGISLQVGRYSSCNSPRGGMSEFGLECSHDWLSEWESEWVSE